jgi:hypothetical protein
MTLLKKDRLKEILAAVYREKEALLVPDGWQGGVMGRIHALPASAWRSRIMDDFAGLSWRFAAAACVLVIMMLSAVAFQGSFQTEYEMARLFIGDPLDFSLVQSMGMN